MAYFSLEVNDTGSLKSSKSKFYFGKFKTVSGLLKRTKVEVAGIVVGFVDDIKLVDNQAVVKLKIRKDLEVYKNASLDIKDKGVLGDKYIELKPGDLTEPLLADGSEITNTHTNGGLQEITDALNQTTTTIRELLQSDEPKGALGTTIVNIRDMTEGLREIVDENQARITKILANLESFTGDMSDISRDNKEQIKEALASVTEVANSLKTALGKDGHVTKATEKLDETMASVQNIVEKVERGEGTLGKIINDETTINNINETVEGLNDTLGVFRRIQLGMRYRGEYLMSSEKVQSLIGFTLAPSPDKYFLFELVDSPIGPRRVTDTVVSSNGTEISSTRTVQTNDRIALSIEFAKRFLDMTLRFGMIRNRGGAGLDFHLFKDALSLSVEGFDFGRDNNRAHLRAYGTLTLYKHLLITGGVDDLANKNGGKDAFIGAGIQFNEQDLKNLIPAVGTNF